MMVLFQCPQKQGLDAHERVRKIVAKRQRHPLGAAKSEFLQDKNSREGLRNSDFVLGNQSKNKATLN